ncbi:MAG: hypothetical protein FD126_3228, partial [Elusimicrobia bacterium]
KLVAIPRRLAFVPATVDPAKALRDNDVRAPLIHETRPATELAQARAFWYVHYQEPGVTKYTVLSAPEILQRLEKGQTILVNSGPFRDRADAQYDLDAKWEEPD